MALTDVGPTEVGPTDVWADRGWADRGWADDGHPKAALVRIVAVMPAYSNDAHAALGLVTPPTGGPLRAQPVGRHV